MVSLFILFLAGLCFVAALGWTMVANTARRWTATEPEPPDFQQILDDRLARGELDVGDYLDRTAALRGEWVNGVEYHPSDPTDPPVAAAPEPDPVPDQPVTSSGYLDGLPLIHVMPGLVESPLPPQDRLRHRRGRAA